MKFIVRLVSIQHPVLILGEAIYVQVLRMFSNQSKNAIRLQGRKIRLSETPVGISLL